MSPANPFRSFTYALLALATAASACSDVTGLERELEDNRALWESEGPASYSFDYHVVCYCLPEVTRPVTITVQHGEVVSVTYVDTGEPVDTPCLCDYPTVDDLFDEIESVLAEDPYSVRVDYDPELGYPADFFVDYDLQIADEEWGFDVLRLDPLPG
ncbi:MAG: hypothetical protein JSV86_10800 [Gemmatimonadota bacterium]|nr:MAG: hypothetical protein JSV86_10800 [Gemmatimonadota bacterium]